MLHLFLVSGSDRLVGLVEWSALCVAAVGASIAAKLLGGNRTGQVVAAAFVTALPMAVVEGSGSKNDVVAAAWVVCCASFVLLFRAEPSLLVALLVGLSAGLAVFTKDTAYLFVAPLLLWFASLIAVRDGARNLTVAALAILVLNAGLYARNFATFGSPLGPGSEQTSQGSVTYTNSTFGPRALASNVIREAALQLVPPWDPAVRAEERAVHDVHRVLGISENFGATTWEGQTFGLPSRSQQLFEDKVPNALPFTLVLIASVIFLLRRRRFGEALLPYAACVAGGALLFCIVLRWQPWNSRLETPLFVLAAPFAAIVVTRYAGRRGALAVGALLLVAVTPWLLLGKPRALVGMHSVLSVNRTTQYFANGGSFERPFRRAATRIADRGCTDVGLITDASAFEYPLWPLLRSSGERRVRVEDIEVHNETSIYPLPRDWSPCAVVVVEPPGGSGLPVPGTLRVAGVTLRPAWAEVPSGCSCRRASRRAPSPLPPARRFSARRATRSKPGQPRPQQPPQCRQPPARAARRRAPRDIPARPRSGRRRRGTASTRAPPAHTRRRRRRTTARSCSTRQARPPRRRQGERARARPSRDRTRAR